MTPRPATEPPGTDRAGQPGRSGQAGQPGRSVRAGTGQAGQVWAAMRELVDSYPTVHQLRDALNLGRGSGRIRSLLWLAEGPASLGGLAEAIGVDAPYATLIVNSLEERGLVARRHDPADRRRKLVSLTPRGWAAVARVRQIQREAPPGFAALTPAELGVLGDLLRRITAGAPGGPSADGGHSKADASPAP